MNLEKSEITRIINGKIFDEKLGFLDGEIWFDNNIIIDIKNTNRNEEKSSSQPFSPICEKSRNITRLNEYNSLEKINQVNTINANGGYIIPGLIDSHLHGADGYDVSDGTMEAIDGICTYELKHGITSVLPATMTLPVAQLETICVAVNQYQFSNTNLVSSKADTHNEPLIYPAHSTFLGLYLEGPFFSSEKVGAQNPLYLLKPDFELVKHLYSLSGNNIKVLSLAPELEGSMEFVDCCTKYLKDIQLSIGHTCADKYCASEAFAHGISRITHLYNAMSFADDIIEAGIKYANAPSPKAHSNQETSDDATVYAELICDGVHNDKARITRAFEEFGDDRIILISDSMRATGLPDGDYTLGGQPVTVRGRLATISNGAKAGSVTNLYECVKEAVYMGIPLESAIKAASYNPARALNLDNRIGALKTGMQPDIVILKEDLSIDSVYKKGFRII